MIENQTPNVARVLSPVQAEGDTGGAPQGGTALCLSGGGYRAMVFHLGSLWRLNECGFLPKLDRISSVSGGSITAAMLGMRWGRLQFNAAGVAQRLVAEVVDPVRGLASQTIDDVSILTGLFSPSSIADEVADAYRDRLYGRATLQDLPDRPRFVINATNVQSRSLFRFSKPFIRDWRVGMVPNPTVELAVAVTASSAFPPFLSPMELRFPEGAFQPAEGEDALGQPPYTTKVMLTDGGVYDNLGLETAWKSHATVLVSDGGGASKPDPEPKRDWARHSQRVLDLIDNQVRSLRKRQLIGSYETGQRKGTYWGIRTNIADYRLATALPAPAAQSLELANTPTRLKALDARWQERLINWGYAVCDAALRTHVDPGLTPPPQWPYPGGIA